MRRRWRGLGLLLLVGLLMSGCAGGGGRAERMCTVVFEDNPQLRFTRQTCQVPAGSDLTTTVRVPVGWRIDSVSYEPAVISPARASDGHYEDLTLTLQHVRYPVLVRIEVAPDYTTRYAWNDGSGTVLTRSETGNRLRFNTLPYDQQLSREGWLPIGWNTGADGSGTHIGFGSRVDHRGTQELTLYCEWLPCTPEDTFDYHLTEDGAIVTGCRATETVVIPEHLGGAPVVGIAAGSFGDVSLEVLALPPTLQFIEAKAFRSLTAERLYLFDGLDEVSDEAFGEVRITQLNINAQRDPVYCGSYFDTLSEKLDYLYTLREERKLVLFCGSSARFGYDSPALEAAFPDYRVVNMGVYAYANMLPQAMLVQQYMGAGDILLSSPELDAIRTQFCGETALDAETFAMMESNYDMLALLDCRSFTGIFDAFAAYQRARQGMTARSYDDIPAWFDEDGQRRETLTYNRSGDYILHREANLDGRLFGVKRACYNARYIREEDWDGLNRVYDGFADRGVRVFFTYSPRSRFSITDDSDASSIAALDAAFRSRLHAPVISSIESSLMDAVYFYGTDNHLTSAGVALHTAQVIEDLRRALEVVP